MEFRARILLRVKGQMLVCIPSPAFRKNTRAEVEVPVDIAWRAKPSLPVHISQLFTTMCRGKYDTLLCMKDGSKFVLYSADAKTPFNLDD
jgi:hypothetical protein